MLVISPSRTLVSELSALVGETVVLRGWVHNRRDLGGIQFLLLRDRSGAVQCVFENTPIPLFESCVEVHGAVVENAKAPGGLEVHGQTLNIITAATNPPPIKTAKQEGPPNPPTPLRHAPPPPARSPRRRGTPIPTRCLSIATSRYVGSRPKRS